MRRLGALALALAALAGGGCGESEQAPSPSSDFFGMNGVIIRAWSLQGREDLVAAHLDALSDTGAGFVRAHIGWPRLEPTAPIEGRHSYDFTETDVWVRALAERGLRWSVMGIGAPTPAWAVDPEAPAVCAGRRPPARPDLLASVLSELAGRYGSQGDFWQSNPDLEPAPILDYEVWNAPNNGGDWCPRPNPEAYADLYAATQQAVRARDPEARVIVGGLGAFDSEDPGSVGQARVAPQEFLERMIARRPELAEQIDAVGIHVYGESAEQVLLGVREFRAEIDAAGLDGVPMVWNEVGWPTSGEVGYPPVTEEARAGLLGAVTARASEIGCGLVAFAPHTWVTVEQDPANPEDWFGIADPVTADPYASADAFTSAVAQAQTDGSQVNEATGCAS